ncbi:MAG: RRXRR domain-containing protein [Chlamydiae bacterium]|nr:RRXRR domain-containing protein [Chlamydiota bacterium]
MEKEKKKACLQGKLDTHIRIINEISSFLPISKINFELATFNIQKIQNPGIESAEYQKGNLYEYENLKSYLTCREEAQAQCQLCGKKSTLKNELPFNGIHLNNAEIINFASIIILKGCPLEIIFTLLALVHALL